MIYEKLCRFKFENINVCKDYYIECLENKLDEIKVTENYQRLRDFIPDELKFRIENNISTEKQEREINYLKIKLHELSFKEIVHQNNNYGDATMSRLDQLYEKFENNDKCLQLITDHIKDEVEFIYEEYIKKNVKTKKQDYRFLLKNIEFLICIEDKFKKIDLKNYKDSCMQILYQKFNEVQNIDKDINMLNNTTNLDLNQLKIYFQLLKELAELESWLFRRSIRINPFPKYRYKLKEIQDKLVNVYQTYKIKLKTEMDSQNSLDISSIKNSIYIIDTFNDILPSDKTEISTLVVKKLNEILYQIHENIENLSINGRKFQAYFEEIFVKIQENSLRIIEIQSIFKDYYSNQDLKTIIDEINGKLKQKINDLFNDFDKQIDSLFNSSKTFSDNIEEMSTRFYNAYYAIISFKVKMPETYSAFFAAKKNINDILIEKIQKKLDDSINCVNKYSINIKNAYEVEENFENICNTFIEIKKISNIFFMFKTEIDLNLDKILNNFIKENGGFEIIGKLALQLRNANNSIGNIHYF